MPSRDMGSRGARGGGPVKGELTALRKRIEAELRDIGRTVQRAQGAWDAAKRFPDQQDYYFDSVALNLHSKL